MDTHTGNKRYFAKEDTWFKAGTECKLIEDFDGMDGMTNDEINKFFG
jgi:hypothetical protein